jgi:hypothetical protein
MMNTLSILDLLEDSSDSSSDSEDEENMAINTVLLSMNQQKGSGDYKVPFLTALQTPSESKGLTRQQIIELRIPRDSVCSMQLMNGELFYRLTIMQPCEFVDLVKQIEPVYLNTPIRHRYGNAEEEKAMINFPSATRQRKLDCYDALLLYIIQLDGTPFDVLAALFRLRNVSSIFEYAETMTKIVNTVLKDCLSWPTANQRLLLHDTFSIYPAAIGILDGTHCRIRVPTDWEEENSYFSGYKHSHTQNYLMVVDPNGFVINLEGPFPGSQNDIACCQQSDIVLNPQSYFSPGERLLADGGFRGFPQFLIPYRVDQLRGNPTQRESMEVYNSLLQLIRSKVEHSIHRVKCRAQVLANRYNRDRKRQFDTITSSVLLHNWTRKHRIKSQM